MSRTHWKHRWLKSQVKTVLTRCFIRNFRRYETICRPEGGSGMSLRHRCGYNILQGSVRSQVFISWVRFAAACFLRSYSLSVNSIFVHTVLHSPTSRISSINNEYLPSLYTKHNFRNCNVATSCFIFSVTASCYFLYLNLLKTKPNLL
jgi:hypothetical protein